MTFLKPLLGLALLAGLVSLTDTTALTATFLQADLPLFGLALALAIAANLICVLRWRSVCERLGIPASYPYLLSAYAQGISANSVLPGGIVGGDAWRSLAIANCADEGKKHLSALTVLLDRTSGFWGLTWLSLGAGLVALLTSTPSMDKTAPTEMAWFDSTLGQAYLLALLLIGVAPVIGRLIHLGWLKRYEAGHHSKWLQLVTQIINAFPVLMRTLAHSFLVQVITVSAFWLCLASVGVSLSWWLLAALCGGVFLSGILPAALGGFGARELGAIAFITPFGYAKEGVLAGSVLFGLTSTIQGLLGLWFWFQTKKHTQLSGAPSPKSRSSAADASDAKP
jgi:uncharacterized protein (TIRG00374 family)